MKEINSWANGVIAVVIIATLLEMILPEGNNKKYIKTIIGIFVLFTIVAPVVSKFTDEKIDFDKIFANSDIYNYTKVETSKIDTDKIILDNYKIKLEEEIKKQIEEKGYKIINISVSVDNEEESYGSINEIVLEVEKSKKTEKSQIVNEIKIDISKKPESKAKIENQDIEEIKKILSENYQIDKQNIIIN